MKILTANIAYGFAGMDRPLQSLKHQLHIHGWGVLTYEFVPPLRGKSSVVSESKRVAYVQKHKHLEPMLEMVKHLGPDVLVLNEVIYELYREELTEKLRTLGFKSIAWGISTHYPGTSITTVVATKQQSTALPCTMPQRPSMGGGAGIAALRLGNTPLTIIGMHMTYGSPELFKRQIRAVAALAEAEKKLGNEVVLAGDWNEKESVIFDNPEFRALGVASADKGQTLTCLTFLPRFLQKSLDHIFIPDTGKVKNTKTIAFGSDHLALFVDVMLASHATH